MYVQIKKSYNFPFYGIFTKNYELLKPNVEYFNNTLWNSDTYNMNFQWIPYDLAYCDLPDFKSYS